MISSFDTVQYKLARFRAKKAGAKHRFDREKLGELGFFSQYGQDKFVAEAVLGGKKKGVFLDVGAHDGISLSNTYYLEKVLNWSGACVEPQPQTFELLKKNRECECINCCINTTTGPVDFLQIDGYSNMLSGVLDHYSSQHRERIEQEMKTFGGTKKVISVPSLTFSELIAQCHISTIDFLSLDTEGGEFEILEMIDFRKIPTAVICVENNEKTNSIYKLLLSRGFRLMAIIGADEIYTNEELRSERLRRL